MLYAQKEAQLGHRRSVTPGDLLVGITRESTVARQILSNLDLDFNLLLGQLPGESGEGRDDPQPGITLSSRSKEVLEYALQAATDLNEGRIGTEHLLVGIMKLQKKPPLEVRSDCEAVLQAIRKMPREERRDSSEKTPNSIIRSVLAKVRKQPPSLVNGNNEGDWAGKFLQGACLCEHLLLCMLAGDGRAAQIIRAQVSNPEQLQNLLLEEIKRYAERGPRRAYPELLPRLLSSAVVPDGQNLGPEHLLLPILDWVDGYELGDMLKYQGISRDETARLLREAPC